MCIQDSDYGALDSPSWALDSLLDPTDPLDLLPSLDELVHCSASESGHFNLQQRLTSSECEVGSCNTQQSATPCTTCAIQLPAPVQPTKLECYFSGVSQLDVDGRIQQRLPNLDSRQCPEAQLMEYGVWSSGSALSANADANPQNKFCCQVSSQHAFARKVGRPRVYDTAAAIQASRQPGLSVPLRKVSRGAKPKYVCGNNTEAIARR